MSERENSNIAVNCLPGMGVNLSTRWSEVLFLLKDKGEVSVKAIITGRVSHGERRSVAKASLSRTLRRLWRAGLVELHNRRRSTTATAVQKRNEMILEREKADPAGEYATFRKYVAGLGARGVKTTDKYGSPEAFLAASEHIVQRGPRLRVTHVELTRTGLEAVNSIHETGVNRWGIDARKQEGRAA